MKIRTNMVLGGVTYGFEFDEKNEMDTLQKAITLSNPPRYCNACQRNSEEFRFSSNKDTEGNTYVNVTCLVCYAQAKLGLYKSGGYFWHKFEKYVKKEENKS